MEQVCLKSVLAWFLFTIAGAKVFPVDTQRIFDVRFKFRELLNISNDFTHGKRSLNSEFL